MFSSELRNQKVSSLGGGGSSIEAATVHTCGHPDTQSYCFEIESAPDDEQRTATADPKPISKLEDPSTYPGHTGRDGQA